MFGGFPEKKRKGITFKAFQLGSLKDTEGQQWKVATRYGKIPLRRLMPGTSMNIRTSDRVCPRESF
jgi:hypothetical protein